MGLKGQGIQKDLVRLGYTTFSLSTVLPEELRLTDFLSSMILQVTAFKTLPAEAAAQVGPARDSTASPKPSTLNRPGSDP